jgi:SAP domain-containing protein
MLAQIVEIPQHTTKLSLEGLILARKLFGLDLYELYDDARGKFICLAWTRNSFKNFFHLEMTYKDVFYDKELCEFVCLRKRNLTKIREQTEHLRVYILQRLLWPHKIFKVRTALEFECCYEVITKDPELAALCTFEPQKDILDYRADCLFKVQVSVLSDVKVPDVVFEVNEDAHKAYSKENEANRFKVIEAFGYRFISANLKRTSSHEEIVTCAAEARAKLKKVVSDLILQYTPNLTAEHFLQVAAENDIDHQLLSLYFPTKDHQGATFFIPHLAVAQYLEYELSTGDRHSAQHFAELIKTKLVEGKDFIIVGGIEPTNKRGAPKKVYMLSRIGFYMACLNSRKPKAKVAQISFVKLSEAALSFATKLRAGLIRNVGTLNCDEKVYAVRERVQVMKDKTKLHKMNERCRDLEAELVAMKEEKLMLETQKDEEIRRLKTANLDLERMRIQNLATGLSRKEYEKMSVAKLREECRINGLESKGLRKAELIEALATKF